jgi:hypothetical protein
MNYNKNNTNNKDNGRITELVKYDLQNMSKMEEAFLFSGRNASQTSQMAIDHVRKYGVSCADLNRACEMQDQKLVTHMVLELKMAVTYEHMKIWYSQTQAKDGTFLIGLGVEPTDSLLEKLKITDANAFNQIDKLLKKRHLASAISTSTSLLCCLQPLIFDYFYQPEEPSDNRYFFLK